MVSQKNYVCHTCRFITTVNCKLFNNQAGFLLVVLFIIFNMRHLTLVYYFSFHLYRWFPRLLWLANQITLTLLTPGRTRGPDATGNVKL